MNRSRSLTVGLAAFFLVLILAGLLARFWAIEQAIRSTGPTHIAAGPDSVFVFAAGDLYQLDGSGTTVAVYPAAVTGLQDDPIDLRVLADGALLIASQQPSSVRICSVSTWECRPLNLPGLPGIKRQFKLLPGRQSDEYFATDARGDMLWRLSSAGQPASKWVRAGLLAGPNDLAFDSQGRLWIADTDNRRIVELEFQGSAGLSVGRRHGTVNEFTSGKRHFPIMLAQGPGGMIWVTQADETGRPYADVLVYDPLRGSVARIDLPPGAYATDIAVQGQGMLITDMDRYAVYRVDSESLRAQPYGDDAFLQRLAEVRSERERYELLSTAALVAVIGFSVLMISAAVLATPRERRWTPVPASIDVGNAPQSTPGVKGIYWLERDPRLDRSLKWLEYLGFAIFVLVVGGSIAIIAWLLGGPGSGISEALSPKLPALSLMLIYIGLLMGSLVAVIRFTVRTMRHRLGTDGRKVYIRLADGRELVADPVELAYSRRVVFYRHHALPLIGSRQQSIYTAGELETWLAPLLRKSQNLTEFQALKRQFRNRKGLVFWPAAGLAALGLFLLLMNFSFQ